MSQFTYNIQQINQELVGGTITAAIVSADDESYGFTVRLPGGAIRNVWVSQDPEGNGPGHLDIEKEPEPKKSKA